MLVKSVEEKPGLMLETPYSYWSTFKASFHMTLPHVNPALLLVPQTIHSSQDQLLKTSHPAESRLHPLCSHHSPEMPAPSSLLKPTSPSYLYGTFPAFSDLNGVQLQTGWMSLPFSLHNFSGGSLLTHPLETSHADPIASWITSNN